MAPGESSIDATEQIRTKLRALWQEHETKRAWGGRWTIAGIALQTHVFLLRFFEGVAANRCEPSELAEVEGLSDILLPEKELITLVQVKRTLDRKALVAALEEAYLITELCEQHCPEGLGRLRFQIAYRCRKTPALPRDIDARELFDGSGKAVAKQFATMLTLQHDTPLIEHADHHDQLYLLLWNEGIRTPKSLIDKAMGRLLAAFNVPTNLNLANLARELAEMFHEAPRHEAWKTHGNLLTLADVTEIPDFPGTGVLVGERVRLDHIKNGYVKRRPRVFDDLIAQFRGWLESVRFRDGEIIDKIPVFWIGGRSGDGKSVLLLQLAQAILTEAVDLPVVHLKSGNAFLDMLNAPPRLEDRPARH